VVIAKNSANALCVNACDTFGKSFVELAGTVLTVLDVWARLG
jgi:hypothetical protein